MKELQAVFQFDRDSKRCYVYKAPAGSPFGFQIYIAKDALPPNSPRPDAVLVTVKEKTA